MKIYKLVVGQLSTNCYLLSNKKGEGIIIDPGDDAEYIKQKLIDYEIIPFYIIATHGHFDHLLAALELKLTYKIPLLMNEKDKFLLARMQSSANFFTGVISDPPPIIDIDLGKIKDITLIKKNFEIIKTPGHTPGSISIYCSDENTCFVGDLVFEGGMVGRSDHNYSDNKKLMESVNKILSLPGDTSIYSAHGKVTTISKLRGYFEN